MAISFAGLKLGKKYERPELAQIWGLSGWQGLGKGVYTPANDDKVVLFVTRHKQDTLTQYEDHFEGDALHWEGESGHRTDNRIANARANGDEIHLFYRDRHHSPFTYYGEIYLTDFTRRVDEPSQFKFKANSLDIVEPLKPSDLRLIETQEEMEKNFWTFQRDARSFPERRQSLLSSTRYWVMDEISGAFGPSKFLGYQNMTFDLYERAKATPLPSGVFDGLRTRVALQHVLDGEFSKDAQLATELQAWGITCFGAGAFGNAGIDKWHFVKCRLPNQPISTDFPDEVPRPKQYFEGATKTVSVNVYERDRRARADCLLHYGTACAVCTFDFALVYGEQGAGFIHVHHVRPLAEIGEGYIVDPVKDLRPVCPNCHAMLHRTNPTLSIEKLKVMLKAMKSPTT